MSSVPRNETIEGVEEAIVVGAESAYGVNFVKCGALPLASAQFIGNKLF